MWQRGDERQAIWKYPAELGSKSIGHESAAKGDGSGDNNWQPPISSLPLGSLGFPHSLHLCC